MIHPVTMKTKRYSTVITYEDNIITRPYEYENTHIQTTYLLCAFCLSKCGMNQFYLFGVCVCLVRLNDKLLLITKIYSDYVDIIQNLHIPTKFKVSSLSNNHI